jgi:glucose/arabinose dehydrogenase
MRISKASVRFSLAIVAAAVLAGASGVAQSTPPAPQRGAPPPASQIPTGRQGRGGSPLPALPAVFETYQHKVRVFAVARGLDRPWSLLILPDGDMLVSMRYANQIRAIRKGVLDPTPLTGLPPMRRLFDIVVHPKFAENKWIYFASKVGTENLTPMAPRAAATTALVCATCRSLRQRPRDSRRVEDGVRARRHDLHDRQRRGRTHQRRPIRGRSTPRGKVIRVRDDGTVPPDNPFVESPERGPKSIRSVIADHFGIAPHPVTGQMFHVELAHGGDKVNILKAGADYGWPDHGHGRNNDSRRWAVRWHRGSNSHCSSGFRASRRRACCSTRAIGSRRGKAT